MEFAEVEPNAIEKDPEGASSSNQDRLPPPIVVLVISRVENQLGCHCDTNQGTKGKLTSAQSWIYVAIMVTSMTVTIHTRLITLKNPKT